jgi:hypothetical protein
MRSFSKVELPNVAEIRIGSLIFTEKTRTFETKEYRLCAPTLASKN